MRLGFEIGAVLALALAGAFAVQGRRAPSAGTLPTDSPIFATMVIGTIVIVTGLSYFAPLALGPIVEQLMMVAPS